MKKLFILLIAWFVTNNIFAQIDYTINAPYTSPTRNTCGAVNNCTFLTSEEHVYQVTIPNNGLWTFSLCSGSSYDTWLEIGTSACANDIASNDDSCGLQSQIIANITAGTYYVIVEGWGGECGNYVLNISGPVQDNVGVISINAPASGCGLTSTESVTVVVENFGTNSQSNIPVSYRINGGGVITENITGLIPASSTAAFTFTNTADLSIAGTYIFDAWTSLAGDAYITNDSLINYQVVTDKIVENICIYDVVGGAGGCDFTSDLCDDGYDWGETTLKTSPSFIINTPTIDSITFYLYYTECDSFFGATAFSFYLNGVPIGSYTNTINECLCNTLGTYPYTFSIINSAILNAAWSGTNTLGVQHNGSDMVVAGYTATVFAQCPSSILPVAAFDITVLDMCQGMVSFTDQSIYNPTTWFWDFGDNSGLSTSQNPFYTYSLPGTYTVTLIVTNLFGSDTITQQIVINSLVADFTVSSNTVGTGVLVSFYDNSIGVDTWNWDFDDGFSSTLQNTSHAYFSPGIYAVALTVSNTSGCIAQNTQQIMVCANVPQSDNIIGPVNVNISDTANYSVSFHTGSTYDWTVIGGNQINGGQTNFITVQWTTAGTGQIIVFETDSVGCSGNTVSLIVNIGSTGINLQSSVFNLQLKVYPNPNTGEFTLEIKPNVTLLSSFDIEIKIISMLGITIFAEKTALPAPGHPGNTQAGAYRKVIDLKRYASGIYLLKIITEQEVITRQINKN